MRKIIEEAFAIALIKLIVTCLSIMTEVEEKRGEFFYTYLKCDGEDFKK